MKNINKKIISIFITCTILAPNCVMAANNTITEYNIKPFSVESKSPTLQSDDITQQDDNLLGFIAENIKDRTPMLGVSTSDGYDEDYLENLITKYYYKYFREFIYFDSWEISSTDETILIELSYNDPLNDDEVRFIEDLVDLFANRQTQIELEMADYNLSTERFGYIYENCLGTALQIEYSDLYYIDPLEFDTHTTSDGKITINAENAYMTDEEITDVNALLDQEYANITALIKEDMTTAEKILIVHDYIVANYEYDNSLSIRTLPYMLTEKKGVCQGYAYLFKNMLNRLNIECINVPSDRNGHMWSKVKVDDEWYNIDLTADDPTPNMTSNISHKFFLVNDSEIQTLDNPSNQLHSTWNSYLWDGKTAVPTSESTAYTDLIIHDITGPVVNYNDKWYGFVNIWDENYLNDNVLSIINIDKNTTEPIYTESAKFIWKTSDLNLRYGNIVSSLVLYENELYFNSPDNVFKFNTSDNTAEEIYTHTDSSTFIYGLTVKDDSLYTECNTAPNGNVVSLFKIPKESDKPIFTGDFSTSITKNSDNTLSISLTNNTKYTPQEDDMIYVAEFVDNNLVNITLTPLSAVTDSLDYTTVNENATDLKVFIWAADYHPLAAFASFQI